MKKWLFIGCVLSILSGWTQDIKQEISEINAYYHTHPNFSFEADYTLYSDSTLTQVIEQMHGTYAKAGRRYFFKGFDIENVFDGTISLVVDHQEKIMIYDQPREHGSDVSRFLDPAFLDTLLLVYQEVDYATIDANTARLDIVLPLSEVRSVQIFYDRQSHRILLTRLRYRHPMETDDGWIKPVLEVSYSNFNAGLSEQDPRFRLSNYLTAAENPEPLTAFEDYEFINLKAQRDATGY